jgi:SAM-dependent methyltransferase
LVIPDPSEHVALRTERRRRAKLGALLRRRFKRPHSSEIRLRDEIIAVGGSTSPRRPPGSWRSWINRTLRSHTEVNAAIAAIREAGLVPHQDAPKNWDGLVALGTILDRVPRRAAVLEMGAARYSPLLPWLYQYGYRSLVGIDLVYSRPSRRGPIRYMPMDLTATSFDDRSFAAIACLSVIEHGVEVEAYLREAARLLRPGGVLVTSTDYWPTGTVVPRARAYGHPVHVFDRPDIERFLAAASRRGFRPVVPVDLEAAERVVRWDRIGIDYTFLVVVLARQPEGLVDWARMARDRLVALVQ